mmetsp:Transcript_17835/g.58290  ORF Transcript_17835/g.58290 Transcript_17835/m.58290 type:complete len:268 (+) Transcript_17835:2023-2826(+)
MVLAVRRGGAVRHRRGQCRVTRHGLRSVQHPGGRPGIRRRHAGAREQHGRARQEPPVGHHLVTRQRGRQWARLPQGIRASQAPRPHAASAVRERAAGAGLVDGAHGDDRRRHRPLCAHVPVPRQAGAVRSRARAGQQCSAAHHVRVLARHGQLVRRARRILARHPGARRAAGWLHLGLCRPGPLHAARPGWHPGRGWRAHRRPATFRLRRRLWPARHAVGRGLLHQRAGAARPAAQPARRGGPVGHAAHLGGGRAERGQRHRGGPGH